MSVTPPEEQPYAAQQPYPQQPYPQQYGANAPAGWVQPGAQQARSRALGVTATIIALAVTALSIGASIVVGLTAAPFAQRTSSSFSFNTGSLTPEQAAAFAPAGALMGAQILLGTVLGIVALVLGIVAVSTKRGRPFGIVAIVAATAAPIVSFIVYATLVAVGVPAA